MSDLISRSMYKSKLLKALDVLNKEYIEAILNEDNDLILAIQNQQSAYMIALRLLDNEPTAYSVDKVVEELEEVAYAHEDVNSFIDLEDAIEIVKQGGVSDDVCEWKMDNVGASIGCRSDLHHTGYVNHTYCPYCGKKIKVVE